MQKFINVNRDELFHHIQISCQIPVCIESLVTCKLVAAAAATAGIRVEPAELQQAADNFRLANNLLQAENTRLWLQKHHLSLDDFEELVYTNALSEKLAQHLFADKVEPWFYERQLDYAGAAMYEVVLTDEDLALELFYALQEGEICFSEVARQYIQEPTLRHCWGYRGIVRRSELKPEIYAAVFASTPPQILKPIVVSTGAHLIWVEEIIQPQLNEQLRAQILAELFSDWLKQQREQVEVVYSESNERVEKILIHD
jgi:parvulin-like peptidyl-prolyl isomerase